MPSSLMTGPHLSSSDLRSAVNSADVELPAIVLMSANRCFVCGWAIAAIASVHTFPTISAGVLSGKKSAYQEDTSNPGTPDSAILGMSGRRLRGHCRRGTADRNDHCNAAADQVGRQCRQPIILAVGPAVFHRHILVLDITDFLQALMNRSNIARVRRC